jgi:hypothetical protein
MPRMAQGSGFSTGEKSSKSALVARVYWQPSQASRSVCVNRLLKGMETAIRLCHCCHCHGALPSSLNTQYEAPLQPMQAALTHWFHHLLSCWGTTTRHLVPLHATALHLQQQQQLHDLSPAAPEPRVKTSQNTGKTTGSINTCLAHEILKYWLIG